MIAYAIRVRADAQSRYWHPGAWCATAIIFRLRRLVEQSVPELFDDRALAEQLITKLGYERFHEVVEVQLP